MKKLILIFIIFIIPIFSFAGIYDTKDGCPIGHEYNKEKCGKWENVFGCLINPQGPFCNLLCYNTDTGACAKQVTVPNNYNLSTTEGIQQCQTDGSCYVCSNSAYNLETDFKPSKFPNLDNLTGGTGSYIQAPMYQCIETSKYDNNYESPKLDISHIGGTGSNQSNYFCPDPAKIKECKEVHTDDVIIEREEVLASMGELSIFGDGESLQFRHKETIDNILDYQYRFAAIDAIVKNNQPYYRLLAQYGGNYTASIPHELTEASDRLFRELVEINNNIDTELNKFQNKELDKLTSELNNLKSELDFFKAQLEEAKKISEINGGYESDYQAEQERYDTKLEEYQIKQGEYSSKKIEYALAEVNKLKLDVNNLKSSVASLKTDVDRLQSELVDLENKLNQAKQDKLPTIKELEQQYNTKKQKYDKRKQEYDKKKEEYDSKLSEYNNKKQIETLVNQSKEKAEEYKKIQESINNVVSIRGGSISKHRDCQSKYCTNISTDINKNYFNELFSCVRNFCGDTQPIERDITPLLNRNGKLKQWYDKGWKLKSLKIRECYQIKEDPSFINKLFGWIKSLHYVAIYDYNNPSARCTEIELGNTGYLHIGNSKDHDSNFKDDTKLIAVMEKTIPRKIQECPYGNTFPCFAKDDGKYYCTSSVCGNANKDLEYDVTTGENNLEDINNWESATFEVDNTCDIDVTMGDGKFSTCRLGDVMKAGEAIVNTFKPPVNIPGTNIIYEEILKKIIDAIAKDSTISKNMLVSNCCAMSVEDQENIDKIINGSSDVLGALTGTFTVIGEIFKAAGLAEENYVTELFTEMINFLVDYPCESDEIMTGILSKSTHRRNGITTGNLSVDEDMESKYSLEYFERLPQADGGNCVYLGNYCDRYTQQDPLGLSEVLYDFECGLGDTASKLIGKEDVPALRPNTFMTCKRQRRAFCCYNSIFDKALAKAGRDQMPEKYGWGTFKRHYLPNAFVINDNGKLEFNLKELFIDFKPEEIRINPSGDILMKPGNDYCNPDEDSIEIDCSGVKIMDLININLDSVEVQKDMEAYMDVMLEEMMEEGGVINQAQQQGQNIQNELKGSTADEIIKDLGVDTGILTDK